MTTGTGLVLLGMWITVAAAWHSRSVPGATALTLTMGVSIATYCLS